MRSLRRDPRRPFHPQVESLEARTVLSGGPLFPVVSPALPAPVALCVVDRLTDTGAGGGWTGDLRYCITRANASPVPDRITFAVTSTINLTRALPDLTGQLSIDGPGPELLTVRRSTGGIYRIFTVVAGAVVQLSGLTLANGWVERFDNGGGIYNAGELKIADTVLTGNYSFSSGGGIYNMGTLEVIASTVDRNFGLATGGGITNLGVARIQGSVISRNEGYSQAGGGGLFNAGDMTIRDSTLSDNAFIGFGDGYGGGVYNAGSLAVYGSTLSGNRVTGSDCNQCDGVGGAIYNIDTGRLTIGNSTLSNNVASGMVEFYPGSRGGGIANLGAVSIANSTVAGNQVRGGEGGGIHNQGTLSMTNIILAGNSAIYSHDLYGVVTSNGYNLIGNTSGGSGFAPTDLLNVNPRLGPLADNGGPTLTHALLPGSPAIDSGDNTDAPPWDQRGPGFPRIVGGRIDIGAFEVQGRAAPGRAMFPGADTAAGVDAAALAFLDRPSRRRAFGWGHPGGIAE